MIIWGGPHAGNNRGNSERGQCELVGAEGNDKIYVVGDVDTISGGTVERTRRFSGARVVNTG